MNDQTMGIIDGSIEALVGIMGGNGSRRSAGLYASCQL